MRQRPGKLRNPVDLRARTKNTVYEVQAPKSFDHAEHSQYIRENCLRDDWAQEYRWRGQSDGTRGQVYLFADSTDAIAFKMRFG